MVMINIVMHNLGIYIYNTKAKKMFNGSNQPESKSAYRISTRKKTPRKDQLSFLPAVSVQPISHRRPFHPVRTH